MIKGLRTTIYKVPDLAQAKTWYAQAFGVAPYFDEAFYAGFNVGGFELGLDPGAPAEIAPGGVVTYWGTDDVRAEYGRLLALGATEHEEPKEVGGDIKVASVLDPFGNIIGLIQNPHFDPKSVR
jgi:lactoylglutathione lyase